MPLNKETKQTRNWRVSKWVCLWRCLCVWLCVPECVFVGLILRVCTCVSFVFCFFVNSCQFVREYSMPKGLGITHIVCLYLPLLCGFFLRSSKMLLHTVIWFQIFLSNTNSYMVSSNLWTPTHEHTTNGRQAKTWTHQTIADTECRLQDWLTIGIDGKRERESQGTPCYQYDLMMMMRMRRRERRRKISI